MVRNVDFLASLATADSLKVNTENRIAFIQRELAGLNMHTGGPTSTGPSGKYLGFLPLKDSAPGRLTKLEVWRPWKVDMMGLFNAQESGVKALMLDAAKVSNI